MIDDATYLALADIFAAAHDMERPHLRLQLAQRGLDNPFMQLTARETPDAFENWCVGTTGRLRDEGNQEAVRAFARAVLGAPTLPAQQKIRTVRLMLRASRGYS